MPRLAQDDFNYQYQQYGKIYSYSNAVRKKNYTSKSKKNNPIKFLISTILVFFAFYSSIFGVKNITNAIIAPIPHNNINADLEEILSPIDSYLSNSWFLGKSSFKFASDDKSAKMNPIDENVNMPVLGNELNYLINLYPVIKPSIYVYDLETGNYVDINAQTPYATASIIKIPILIDLFKSIEISQVSLNDEVPLTEYFRTEGSGNLQFKAQNSVYSIDNLARLMITESDNSATNMIVAKIGNMSDLNQSIRDWGLKNTQMNNWLPDYKGTNISTAKELATMLYNVETNDKFLKQESKEKIIDYMSHVHNDRLLPAGIGAGATIYHKTGDIGTMLGDAGVITTPNGKKYIAVILANRPHNDYRGKEFIVKASEIIYNYMVK